MRKKDRSTPTHRDGGRRWGQPAGIGEDGVATATPATSCPEGATGGGKGEGGGERKVYTVTTCMSF